MRRRLVGTLALLATLGTAYGCAQGYFLASDAPAREGLRRLSVLPLNFDQAPPSAWVDGLDRLAALVESHLESTGRRIDRVKLGDALHAWDSAMRAVGGVLTVDARLDSTHYAAAREELARSLIADGGADAVVMATVIRRRAIAEGQLRSRVEWDGVSRDVPIEIHERRHQYYPVSGEFKVSSLRVTVFGPDGRLLFERVRGLEVLERIHVGADEFWSRDRVDLFEDEALLREEVETVFEPLFAAGG